MGQEMQTRRQLLASFPVMAAPIADQAGDNSSLDAVIQRILADLTRTRGGQWASHIEPDFILISRKL